MRNMCFGLVAAMSLALASPATAGLVGSSVSGSLEVTAPTAADPSGPFGPVVIGPGPEYGTCIGPPVSCGAGSGLSVAVDITDTTIDFAFFGSTSGSTGSFALTLNFAPIIQNVELASGSFDSFGLTSSTSSSMVFTGTGEFNAIGGNFVTFNVTTAVTTGVWAVKADVPSVGAGVEGMSVGVTDAYIVAAYGFDPGVGDTNTTRVYSVATNTWSIGAPAPLPVRSEGIGVLRDGKLYSIGGRSEGVLSNLDRYHKNTDTWVSLAPMPTARAGLGGTHSGKYLYAIGGRTGTSPCTGTALDVVERYNTQTNTWATLAPLPVPRSDLGAIAMGNSKIYVFGGCDASNQVVGDVFIYDIVAGTWSTGPDMPTPRAFFYQVASVSNKIYVMGGGDVNLTVSAANEVFDISNNTWSLETPMLTPRGEMGVGSIDGVIWTVGGAVPAFGISSNALETFTP